MKLQALFSSKDKSKKLKCRLLQFLFGALRVNDNCLALVPVLFTSEQEAAETANGKLTLAFLKSEEQYTCS